MFGIVIHDSFVHALPFYYVLFFLGGIVIGRFVASSDKLVVKENVKQLTLEFNPIGIVVTLLLLVIRFFAGKLILEEFRVIWAADALYLLFIGIYYARIKHMIRQFDEKVYEMFFEER
jgi:uncharacterized membrane protein AbrB (regulator of aidB expression)